MKSRSKVLGLVLAGALLLGATYMGALAYLNDTDEAENTFTVGAVDITLDETDVDENGDKDGEDRVKENEYKLMPGHEYTKDPMITVAEKSEDCYLFVKVVDGIAGIEDDTTVADQLTANGWVAVAGAENVYVYGTAAAPTVVSAEDEVQVFDTFKIKDDIDGDDLVEYDGKSISITAYAVQADGFDGKSASEIWTAANFQ